jgi:hypothetical protein
MLTSDQRVQISGKIIAIPEENKSIDQTIAMVETEVVRLESLDNGNKFFYDQKNTLVNAYQPEIAYLNGTGRTEITETLLNQSVDMVVGNILFPNDTTANPPSLSTVWTQLTPFLLGYGVGKTKLEAYTLVTNEQDLTATINAQITIIEGFTDIIRATGQSCTVSMSPPDVIADDPAMQAASTAILNAVNSLVTVLTNMQASLYLADPDSARASANATASSNITVFLGELNSWLAYPTFTAYPGGPSCPIFNSYPPGTLPDTKYNSTILQILKDALTDRLPIFTARVSQVNTWLGGLSQNVTTGATSGFSGFYGDRALFLIQRMHRLTGSLQKKKSLENSVAVNEEFKTANINTGLTYDTVMVASKFLAPGNKTHKISVANPNFAVGQTAYVCSNSQPEIEVVIRSVQGFQVELSKPIPSTYRENEGARIYRLL